MTILIAEDCPHIVAIYRRMFRDHEVIAVKSADDAITTLRLIRPDFIVSDYDLESGTGRDVWEYVQENQPDVPFVLVTGRTDIEHFGALTIYKPFDARYLRSVILGDWNGLE